MEHAGTQRAMREEYINIAAMTFGHFCNCLLGQIFFSVRST